MDWQLERTHSSVTRHVRVTSDTVIDDPWSTSGRRFRVERLIITYRLTDGAWRTWLSSITVVGHAVNKKGGITKIEIKRSGNGLDLPGLDDIIEDLRPAAVEGEL